MIDLHREQLRIKHANYRAEKAGTPATLTLEQWLITLNHFNGLCAYCGQSDFEVLEHVLSIPKGGGTMALNCVPACRSCNSRKDRNILDQLPQKKIKRVKSELEKIAKALGVKPGELIISDEEYQTIPEQEDMPEAA